MVQGYGSAPLVGTSQPATPRRKFPLVKVYGRLEPGPVIPVATADKDRRNVMILSWQTMLDFEPPALACVVGDRNFSFGVPKRGRQCVIAIPTVERARQVVQVGDTSGRGGDKFAQSGLIRVAASRVGAPLIAECYANLECQVIDTRMVSRYNLFVLDMLHAWMDRAIRTPRTLHDRAFGVFVVAGETVAGVEDEVARSFKPDLEVFTSACPATSARFVCVPGAVSRLMQSV